MAKNLSEGSKVRYAGELPDDWSRDGVVIVVTEDASADRIVTVDFDGHFQDIPESDLERDLGATRDLPRVGVPF